MDNESSTEAAEVIKPYLIELYEQGIEKGLKKGLKKGMKKGMKRLILAFLKKNPTWTDEQVAEYFEIEAGLVKQVLKG